MDTIKEIIPPHDITDMRKQPSDYIYKILIDRNTIYYSKSKKHHLIKLGTFTYLPVDPVHVFGGLDDVVFVAPVLPRNVSERDLLWFDFARFIICSDI